MKILAIGRNYTDHIKELNNEVPEEPVIFLKPDTALQRSGQSFYYPEFSEDVHFELELILRISKEGKNISEAFGNKYFDGIGLGIDFTARDLQQKAKTKGLPWDLAKGFNGSAPVSEFKPLSDFPDLNNISFRLEMNGEVRQQGNSGQMIHNFAQIISYISRFITLKKGDIIFTGTPAGVGPVQVGDVLKGYLGNEELLSVPVK
jgi:acylpyruvate hydrolase